MIKLPENLKKEIQDQIIKNSARGEKGWRFSKKEEDSLLGDYLGNLRTDKKNFYTNNENYEWEVLYHKVLGRSPKSYEKVTGADAIITFEIFDKISNKKTLKSLIFQAKKEGNDSGLEEQKSKMDSISKDGNFIFTCSQNGYFAQTEIGGKKTNIGEFLAYQFIECKIGVENFEYDEKKELLVLNGKYIERVKLEEVVVKVEIEKNHK